MTERSVLIIGGGIAGLCAAIYARKCGYQAEVLEMHDAAGGLATSWRRGDYTFETCLHALGGSSPKRSMHALWQEVCDIDKLTFVIPDEYMRVENAKGEKLSLYTNLDRMEAELLEKAPQDGVEIRHLVAAARKLATFEMPDPTKGWPANWLTYLRSLRYLPLLRQWSGLSSEEYGRKFTHPLIRSLFAEGSVGQLFPAIYMIMAFASLSQHDGGYPIGGSQAVIRLVVDRLRSLGGTLRLGAKVETILVERDAAVGVKLAGGETVAADWVISTADGHATIYQMLSGSYTDKVTDRIYGALKPFPSYLQVSLEVAQSLSKQAAYVTRVLEAPLTVDPETKLGQISFRFFHFDPTFAPPGKTAVTCFIPTHNSAFWVRLRQEDPARYQAEKHRIADAVIAILEESVPGIRSAIEVMDVSTPATVIRYTGNWKGSMEGWLQTPEAGFGPLRNTLPGLRQFMMAGQWVMPGGGLLPGLMSARAAIATVCRNDRMRFVAREATDGRQGREAA